MKKNCLIVVLLLFSFICRAQRSEVGALVGTSFYLGDLNNIPFRYSKFAGGLIYRYNFTPRMALKADILFGTLAASDEKNHSLLTDVNDNYLWDYRERKLSFTSPITEISAQLEINFFNVYNVGHKNQISPYLFGGVAFFSFDPQAVYNDTLFHLQPIGTEGQGREGMAKKYSLTGFAIPLNALKNSPIATIATILNAIFIAWLFPNISSATTNGNKSNAVTNLCSFIFSPFFRRGVRQIAYFGSDILLLLLIIPLHQNLANLFLKSRILYMLVATARNCLFLVRYLFL